MTIDEDARYLELIGTWLAELAPDARALLELAEHDGTSSDAKRALLSGLNALLKSVDLIPDGLADLGYVDDAFMLRVVANLALDLQPQIANLGAGGTVCARLAGEDAAIERFLGAEIHARLVRYVHGLAGVAVRGRRVDDLLEDAAAMKGFGAELSSWCAGFESPGFGHDERNLIRLRAFLDEATKHRV